MSSLVKWNEILSSSMWPTSSDASRTHWFTTICTGIAHRDTTGGVLRNNTFQIYWYDVSFLCFLFDDSKSDAQNFCNENTLETAPRNGHGNRRPKSFLMLVVREFPGWKLWQGFLSCPPACFPTRCASINVVAWSLPMWMAKPCKHWWKTDCQPGVCLCWRWCTIGRVHSCPVALFIQPSIVAIPSRFLAALTVLFWFLLSLGLTGAREVGELQTEWLEEKLGLCLEAAFVFLHFLLYSTLSHHVLSLRSRSLSPPATSLEQTHTPPGQSHESCPYISLCVTDWSLPAAFLGALGGFFATFSVPLPSLTVRCIAVLVNVLPCQAPRFPEHDKPRSNNIYIQ